MGESKDYYGNKIQTKVLTKPARLVRPRGRVVAVTAPYDDLHDSLHSIPDMIVEARVEYEGQALDVENMFVTIAYTTFDILLEIGPIE